MKLRFLFSFVASLLMATPLLAQVDPGLIERSQKVEASLEKQIQAGLLKIKGSKEIPVPASAELTGFKCSDLPEFSRNEGIDDLIRLEGLKYLRANHPPFAKISDYTLHALKQNSVDQLLRAEPKNTNFLEGSAVVEMLKDRKARGILVDGLRDAQVKVWKMLSLDLRNEIAAEIKAQTGKSINADQLLDPKTRALLKEAVLCIADIQIDEERVSVLVPVENGQVLTSRPLVDVGFNLSKLNVK